MHSSERNHRVTYRDGTDRQTHPTSHNGVTDTRGRRRADGIAVHVVDGRCEQQLRPRRTRSRSERAVCSPRCAFGRHRRRTRCHRSRGKHLRNHRQGPRDRRDDNARRGGGRTADGRDAHHHREHARLSDSLGVRRHRGDGRRGHLPRRRIRDGRVRQNPRLLVHDSGRERHHRLQRRSDAPKRIDARIHRHSPAGRIGRLRRRQHPTDGDAEGERRAGVHRPRALDRLAPASRPRLRELHARDGRHQRQRSDCSRYSSPDGRSWTTRRRESTDF